MNGRLTVDAPPGPVTVIGRNVMISPPLVDAHAHLAVRDGRADDSGWSWASNASDVDRAAQAIEALLANARAGVLAVRDAGGASSVVAQMATRIPPHLPWLQASGRVITGPGRHVAGVAHEARGDRVAAAALAEASAGGAWVKLVGDAAHRDRPDEEPACDWAADDVRLAVEAAHGVGARVIFHALTNDAVRLGLAADIDSIEHGWGLVDSDLRAMAARRIAWTPTAGSMLASFDAAVQAGATVPRFLAAAREALPTLVANATTSGVTILCGTDLGLPHGAVAREMLTLIDFGLPIDRALSAATVDSWAFMGLPPPKIGGIADVLVLADDPTERPETYLSPVAVVRGGELVMTRQA